ncbi:hypothetical protein ACVR1G_08315 [Streptococcus dentasini]
MENNGNTAYGFYRKIGENKFVYWTIDDEDWVTYSGIISLRPFSSEEVKGFMSTFVDVITASTLGLGAGFALVGYDGSRQQEAEDDFDEFYKEIVLEDKEIDYRTLKSLVPNL